MVDPESFEYEEFALLTENIDEFDLDVGIPPVERIDVSLPTSPGRHVSALRWGTSPVEVVFVHGGAQNAHTWDTVALALGRPALAIDLPGHGHSHWRDDGAYSPTNLADDIAVVVSDLAPDASVVVGMSLGGLTSMHLAVRHPHLVRSLVMVDITPGVDGEKAKAIIDFVDGPQEFASFDDLLARTIEHNPTRSESSLRRGILHNAAKHPDGSWRWRYDRSSHSRARERAGDDAHADGSGSGEHAGGGGPVSSGGADPSLWDVFGAVEAPMTLVRGSASPVVDDDDVAEARRRQPDLDVRVVDGAGHSVQGDRPVELAAILDGLLG
ncbi:alpha/beta fold hydrolase [Ilumatobacter sp.]|uniref:alpha/beta fold hydrolase n=1 Tax=Ilumatobacter sp. TaxID=1967498 RepID=UPI003B51A30A